jgi:phosphoribosylanthranilate isomerase
VCGLRTAADLRAAEGADAVGFVVASPGSKRNLDPPVAGALLPRVPPFVQSVLVTRERDPAHLAALHGAVPAQAVQVHGVPDAAYAQMVRKAIQGVLILALPADARAPALAARLAPHADALLLDTKAPDGQTGGTGQAHDWRLSARVVKASPKPVILAGGLTPANVAEAVRVARPYAVDVSGGVEGPRGKSRAKVQAFLKAVRAHG